VHFLFERLELSADMLHDVLALKPMIWHALIHFCHADSLETFISLAGAAADSPSASHPHVFPQPSSTDPVDCGTSTSFWLR
jgi:hypothetical protein